MPSKLFTTVVIDDSPLQLFINKKMVQRHRGLRLVSAHSNPIEGLSAIKTKAVNLVILDLEMPKLSGLEIITRLKGQCKILVYSSNLKMADKALSKGADAFLYKNSTTDQFMDCVDLLLYRSFKRVPVAV